VIEVFSTFTQVDTENFRQLDVLHTIIVGGDGDMLVLKTAHPVREILLKETGNITVNPFEAWGNNTLLMNVVTRMATLQHNGFNWVLKSYSEDK